MKNSREGVRPNAGVAPLETILDRAITAPEIRLRLAPLPGSSAGGPKRKFDEVDSDTSSVRSQSKSDEVSRLKRTIENLSGQVKNLKGRSSKPAPAPGKGKSFGKGSKGLMSRSFRSTVKMPPQLVGQSPMTDNGEPTCYSYNLNGCPDAAPGQRCSKGWHLCTKPGCQAVRSQRDHK